MPVSAQSCLALIDQLSVLGLVKRELRRSGTRSSTAAMTALAVLDTSMPDPAGGSDKTVVPMRLTTLAERLQVDPSVASRQVTHLIETGAVERVADERDGRVHRLRVTPAGRRLLSQARQQAAEMIAEQLTNWQEPELSTLVHLLGRLRSELRTEHINQSLEHDSGASVA